MADKTTAATAKTVPTTSPVDGIPTQTNPENITQWAHVFAAIQGTDEPAKSIARVAGIVSAAVVVLAAFAIKLDDQTQNALVALGVALLPVFEIVGALIRAKVTPTGKAQAVVDAAYKMVPTPGEGSPKL